MPLDHYVTLGRSGLAVSPFCLGSMTFGEEWGWGVDAKKSGAILDHFLDRGGNFIDTANVYNYGHSEKIIGDNVGRSPERRQRVVIATKFCNNLYPGNPNTGGASRKAIMAACEQSLRRLQTDYIDLYWLHAWDWYTPVEETLRALDDLVTAGKVRYIGFSNTPAWKTAEAQVTARFRGWAPLIALQIEYSLLERTVEGELIPMARELGLAVTPWSPLKFGILSGKYTPENIQTVQSGRREMVSQLMNEKACPVLDELRRVARNLGTTPARVALAWLQSRPGVTSTIIGARTIEQLEDNIGALEVVLPAEHLAALDEVSKPALNFPADFQELVVNFVRGGVTLNGRTFPVLELFLPTSDEQRF